MVALELEAMEVMELLAQLLNVNCSGLAPLWENEMSKFSWRRRSSPPANEHTLLPEPRTQVGEPEPLVESPASALR